MKNQLHFLFLLPIFLVSITYSSAQFNTLTSNCNSEWLLAGKGDDLGRTGLVTADIDNDGIIEIITGANINIQSSSSESSFYWYVMKYNESGEQTIYRESEFHENNPITQLNSFDLNQDSIHEIFIGHENGLVEIYNGLSFEKENIINTNLTDITNFLYADYNNDGIEEMLISNRFRTEIYDPQGWVLQEEILYGGHTILMGNIDDDANLEIAFGYKEGTFPSGVIMEFDGTNEIVEMDSIALTIAFGLTDVDDDGRAELVFRNFLSFEDNLKVYDVETEFLKYEIPIVDGTLSVLALADVNNDGREEAIVSARQTNIITAYDLQTQEELWQFAGVSGEGTGTAAINFFDIDGDLEQEMVLARGYYTTTPDDITSINLSTITQEWTSGSFELRNFYVVDIADVDSDNTSEIVFFEKGNLFALDGNTKVTEWMINLDDATTTAIGFILDIRIGNIDDDPAQEIVLVGGDFSNGIVIIIDANSLTVQGEFIINESINISNVDIGDVDGDGQVEIIFDGKTAPGIYTPSKIHVFNGVTGSIEWSSGNIPYSSDTYPFIESFEVGNIDDDPQLEIVFNNSIVQVIDGLTHEQWEYSPSADFPFITTMNLSDINNDGIKEIITAGKNNISQPPTGAKIRVLDGNTQEVISEYDTYVESVLAINAQDIDNDDVVDFFYSSEGRFYYFKEADNIYQSKNFAQRIGYNSNFFLEDVNNNGEIELLFNSSRGIHQVGKSCISCTSFSSEIITQDPTCPTSVDGSLTLSLDYVNFPVSYNWSTGGSTSIITDLEEGDYQVTVTDNSGCETMATATLTTPVLELSTNGSDASCSIIPDGNIATIIISTNLPYALLWSNNSTMDTLENLSAGTYSVTITDANNCTTTAEAEVVQSFSEVSASVLTNNCNDQNQAIAVANPTHGSAPFEFQWSTGIISDTLSGLSNGTYQVTITDLLNCTAVDSIEISSAYLSTSSQVIQNSCNNTPTGIAMIDITLGTAPYNYNWSSGNTTSIDESLTSGIYFITISDANNCSVIDSITISQTILDIENTIQDASCFGNTDGSIAIEILQNTFPIDSFFWSTNDTSMLIDNLPAGEYTFTIFDSTGCEVQLESTINQPEELMLDVSSTPDTTNSNGTATVNVATGGVPPFTYLWNDANLQNSQTATGLTMGEYMVTITDANNCTNSISVFVDNYTSLRNLDALDKINIYPNPAQEYLQVDFGFPSKMNLSLEIFSPIGIEVKPLGLYEIDNNSIKIPIKYLPSGLYYLKIKDEKNQFRVFSFSKIN
jgi:hypothetical protein